MRSHTRRLLATLATLPLAAGLIAADHGSGTVEATETLFISAGCAQDTPGTCTSTRWLGRVTGDSTTNYLTSTTPVDEVLFRTTGAVNWREYPSDLSLRTEGYLLDISRPLEIDVRVQSNAVTVNNTAHARASLRVCDKDETGAFVNCSSTTVNGDDQTVTVLPMSSETVEFDIELPDELEGRWLRSLTVEIAVHGVNAQGGYIDQQGGSPVRIPHLELVVEEPVATQG